MSIMVVLQWMYIYLDKTGVMHNQPQQQTKSYLTKEFMGGILMNRIKYIDVVEYLHKAGYS